MLDTTTHLQHISHDFTDGGVWHAHIHTTSVSMPLCRPAHLPTVIMRYSLGTIFPAYCTISYKSAQCCFPDRCASLIYVDKNRRESKTAISTCISLHGPIRDR